MLQLAEADNDVKELAVLYTGWHSGDTNSWHFVGLSDLTLDAGWNLGEVNVRKTLGVAAYCENALINNVRVINCGSVGTTNGTFQETFAIAWTPKLANALCRATITDCVVEGPVLGDQYSYGTAISALGSQIPGVGSSVVIRNNRVVNYTNGIAYGLAGRNGVLENNFAINCWMGFNTDSHGPHENIVIRNNVFRDVVVGLKFGQRKAEGTFGFIDYVIDGNYFELTDEYVHAVWPDLATSGLWFAYAQSTNVIVNGNVILPAKGLPVESISSMYGLRFSSSGTSWYHTGYNVANNLIEGLFTNHIPSNLSTKLDVTDGSVFFNNHDLIGAPLMNLPPDAAHTYKTTAIDVSGSSYSMGSTVSRMESEGFVTLEFDGTSSTKTITLNDPAWHRGRNFRLCIRNSLPCYVLLTTAAPGSLQIFSVDEDQFLGTLTNSVSSSGVVVYELVSSGEKWFVKQW